MKPEYKIIITMDQYAEIISSSTTPHKDRNSFDVDPSVFILLASKVKKFEKLDFE